MLERKAPDYPRIARAGKRHRPWDKARRATLPPVSGTSCGGLAIEVAAPVEGEVAPVVELHRDAHVVVGVDLVLGNRRRQPVHLPLPAQPGVLAQRQVDRLLQDGHVIAGVQADGLVRGLARRRRSDGGKHPGRAELPEFLPAIARVELELQAAALLCGEGLGVVHRPEDRPLADAHPGRQLRRIADPQRPGNLHAAFEHEGEGVAGVQLEAGVQPGADTPGEVQRTKPNDLLAREGRDDIGELRLELRRGRRGRGRGLERGRFSNCHCCASGRVQTPELSFRRQSTMPGCQDRLLA